MKTVLFLFIVNLALNLNCSAQDTLQTNIGRKDALNIYLDCTFCDRDYIKKEIPFVNYVRDRREAQVYLMITQQPTGSGGDEYTLHYFGQKDFQGMNDTLKYISNANNTGEEIRSGQVRVMKLGLMRYVVRTPLSSEIGITYNAPIEEEVREDKWKNWVFRIGLNGYGNGQKSYQSWILNSSFNVSKVTSDWKYNFDGYYSLRHSSYEISSETFLDERHSESFSGLIVKSLSDHWSVGGNARLSSSTYRNLKLSAYLSPGLEYDIFPYSESTRKQLRILYTPGIEINHYVDTTLYHRIRETLAKQSLQIAFSFKKKWGSVNSNLTLSNYFYDWSENNLSLYTNLSFRVAKGLQIQMGGFASLVHDQINLPKGSATDQEILLRIRELESSYNYFISFGISYTFGSIYNNVVNPRFGGSGGSGSIIIIN
ncbi:MAG: DUF481 domain-containing protein [Chlorobi bacterium]|nr:DUF481 domain-containing protein [Chlorobiota bacterium]